MVVKIKYASSTERNARVQRERRDREPSPSSIMSAVQQENYLSLWAKKMKDHDPDGEIALRIARRYRG